MNGNDRNRARSGKPVEVSQRPGSLCGLGEIYGPSPAVNNPKPLLPLKLGTKLVVTVMARVSKK